jgi:hypothetical protein
MNPTEIKQLREVLADAEAAASGMPKPKSKKKDQPAAKPSQLQSQFSFLGGAIDVAGLGLSTFDSAFASLDLAKRTFDSGTTKANEVPPQTDSEAVNDVASQLRNLSPDQGAVLLEDMSLAAQAKLLSLLSPAQAASLIQSMRTDSAAKGGLLLKLPNRVRGLVVVELKPAVKVAVLESINTNDAYRLLLSIDAPSGDRFKVIKILFIFIFAAITTKII